MTERELSDRIKASPALSNLCDEIAQEVTFHADNNVQFDPITIVMIISIVVQIIIHCRNNRDDSQIVQDIRDIRTLPPRQLIRLRRKLNKLWREKGGDNAAATTYGNPFLTALYEIGERADDDALQALLQIANDYE